MKLIWSRASWVIHRYQLNMLPEIHENIGFYTTYSRARLAGPVFVCLLCFFRKKIFSWRKWNIYTYIHTHTHTHICVSPCFPDTNCQQRKKGRKKKGWLTNTMNYGPKHRKILKMDGSIYRNSMGHRNLQKWEAHVWRDCLIWFNGIWRNDELHCWILLYMEDQKTKSGLKEMTCKLPVFAGSRGKK